MLGYSIVMEALSCPTRQITSSYLTRLPTYTPASSVRTNNDSSLFNLADGVGFEPTDAFTSAVFKTSALVLSATRP